MPPSYTEMDQAVLFLNASFFRGKWQELARKNFDGAGEAIELGLLTSEHTSDKEFFVYTWLVGKKEYLANVQMLQEKLQSWVKNHSVPLSEFKFMWAKNGGQELVTLGELAAPIAPRICLRTDSIPSTAAAQLGTLIDLLANKEDASGDEELYGYFTEGAGLGSPVPWVDARDLSEAALAALDQYAHCAEIWQFIEQTPDEVAKLLQGLRGEEDEENEDDEDDEDD